MILSLKATVLHSMEPNEGESATLTQDPEASESSPVKKSVMAELFDELFKAQVGNTL